MTSTKLRMLKKMKLTLATLMNLKRSNKTQKMTTEPSAILTSQQKSLKMMTMMEILVTLMNLHSLIYQSKIMTKRRTRTSVTLTSSLLHQLYWNLQHRSCQNKQTNLILSRTFSLTPNLLIHTSFKESFRKMLRTLRTSQSPRSSVQIWMLKMTQTTLKWLTKLNS